MNPAKKQKVSNEVLYVKLDGYEHQGKIRRHGTDNLSVEDVRNVLKITDQKIEDIGEEKVRFLFFSPTKTEGTFPYLGDDLVVEYLYFSQDQLTRLFEHQGKSTFIIFEVQRYSTVPDLSISENRFEPTFNVFDNVFMNYKMSFSVTWEHLKTINNDRKAVVIDGFQIKFSPLTTIITSHIYYSCYFPL